MDAWGHPAMFGKCDPPAGAGRTEPVRIRCDRRCSGVGQGVRGAKCGPALAKETDESDGGYPSEPAGDPEPWHENPVEKTTISAQLAPALQENRNTDPDGEHPRHKVLISASRQVME